MQNKGKKQQVCMGVFKMNNDLYFAPKAKQPPRNCRKL